MPAPHSAPLGSGPRYFPFESGPHRLRVGARTLDVGTWIELGPDADGQLDEKRRLLVERPDDVVGVLPGATPEEHARIAAAAAELRDLLADHLVTTFPDRYAYAERPVLPDGASSGKGGASPPSGDPGTPARAELRGGRAATEGERSGGRAATEAELPGERGTTASRPGLLASGSGRPAPAGSVTLVDPRSGGPYVDPVVAQGLHPLDLAARWVPEDLCLHLPGPDGVLRLVAGSVAFPAGWALREKLGRPLGAIHGPVPGYEAAIGRPVDRVLGALTPARGIWRLNGSIVDDAVLFRPEYPRRVRPPRIPEDIVIRSERQTLRRLPVSGAVVFTIRTYVDPLTSIENSREARRTLAAYLRALPPDQRRYKRMEDLAEPLADWLDS